MSLTTLIGIGLLLASLGIAIGIFVVHRRQRTSAFLDPEMLRHLSWDEFEVLIAESFRRDGFVVREESGGGVDQVLEKGEEKFLVQCKHWKAKRVGAKEIRELYGIMAAHNATGSYLITAGMFSKEAILYASGKRIELIDGPRLVHLIEEAQQEDSEITDSRLGETMYDESITQPKRVILCPRCGRNMARKTEKVNNGEERAYYGCSNFPTCKGRRDIAPAA
ncbi:MAG: DUF2034 domain-containing protein [Gammaproteobacteria bacterium]